MAGPLERLAVGLATASWLFTRDSTRTRSLDQLRSDLAHETASRLAFLSALAGEWRRGRYQNDDPGRCERVLAELRMLYRQYAQTAFGHGHAWHHLVGALTAIRALSRVAPAAPAAAAVTRFEGELARLRTAGSRLVEALTARHAVDLAAVVAAAAADLREEPAGRLGHPVAIEVAASEGLPHVWLPRADAVRWRDVVRNLIRNAIEATRSQWPPEQGPCPPVRVSLSALPTGRGTRLEIADLGTGMSASERRAMWVAGAGRHGAGRGQGLTEAKREFVARRTELTVSSEVGRGTSVALDFAPRDLELPKPGFWRQPAWQVALLLVLVASALSLQGALRPPAAHSVRIARGTAVQGLGPRGEVLWDRELSARILPNDHLHEFGITDPAVFRDTRGERLREILVATRDPEGGPGRLEFLDGRGRSIAARKVQWIGPRGEGPAELASFWQAPIVWRGGPERAFVVDVRKGNRSPESLQVVTAGGEDLGAYHHPGQVKFFACQDFDGDDREEFLFSGINNDAWRDSLVVDCPPETWHACAFLLPTPPWRGQAYPWRAWADLPAAAELAYLLIAPLECGGVAPAKVEIVEHVSGDGPVRLLLRLGDGRIVETDGRLRPVRFDVGDMTPASRLEREGRRLDLRAAYYGAGGSELIDVPRRGGQDE